MKGKVNWVLCVLIVIITCIFIYKDQLEIRKLKNQLYDLEKRDTYNLQVLVNYPTHFEWVSKSDKVPKFSELKIMTSEELDDFISKIGEEFNLLYEKHSEAIKSIGDAEHELTRNARTKSIADQILIDNQDKLKPLKEAEQSTGHDFQVAGLTLLKANWVMMWRFHLEHSNAPYLNGLTKYIFRD